MSRCHACGLSNLECHAHACAPRALAVGEREDLGRRWIELEIWKRTEVWYKHAWPTGLGDLEVTEYIARIRRGPAQASTCQRPKQDSCLTNIPFHSFIVSLTF